MTWEATGKLATLLSPNDWTSSTGGLQTQRVQDDRMVEEETRE